MANEKIKSGPGPGVKIKETTKDSIIKMAEEFISFYSSSYSLRELFLYREREFARQQDFSDDTVMADWLKETAGDQTKFRNIIIPLVAPQVVSAVNYQTEVFLSEDILFPVVAEPKYLDGALQVQVKIDDDATIGGWHSEFEKLFFDGGKYNFFCAEVSWQEKRKLQIVNDPASSKNMTTEEVTWGGNVVKRINPYQFFGDTRVPPTELHKRGEFAGYTEIISRIELKQLIADLGDNYVWGVKEVLEAPFQTFSGFDTSVPIINPYATNLSSESFALGPDINWLAWGGLEKAEKGIKYSGAKYCKTVLYARVIPQELGIYDVPGRGRPSIYKFIIINASKLLYMERLENVHDFLPILCGQFSDTGLGYQDLGIVDNVAPLQHLGSALVNSSIAARRRAISDRGIYNPFLIDPKHMNSDSPTAKIPMRPAGYGKHPGEAYQAMPFNDNTSGMALQELSIITNFADSATNRNQARQGQFIKGNKTNNQWNDVMAGASGADKATSLHLEATFFTPLKEIIKSNTLQYSTPQVILDKQAEVSKEINPATMRSAIFAFKLTDGLRPIERVAGLDITTTALQVLGSSPQISQNYHVAELFSYLMKQQGAKLSEFEKSKEELMYEQALGAWQQAARAASDKGVAFNSPQPLPEQYGIKRPQE
jgi:hypothetical protein